MNNNIISKTKYFVCSLFFFISLEFLPVAWAGQPYMVKDINTAPSSSNPGQFAGLNVKVYFSADDGVHGESLWMSTGTGLGTAMVKNIRPDHLVNAAENLFFIGDSGGTLYVSDGTDVGTVPIRTGCACSLSTAGSDSVLLVDYIGLCAGFFDDKFAQVLWRSDGTAEGTRNIYYGYEISNITDVQGTVFFTAAATIECPIWGCRPAGQKLYKNDGTQSVMLKDFSNGPYVENTVSSGGSLFFFGGSALWKSDGTTEGTVEVKQLGFNPLKLTEVEGFLYFTNDYYIAGVHHFEIWKSDGTDAGTVMLKNLTVGDNWEDPSGFTNANGIVYFSADDGVHGSELWKSDGTALGTVIVKDINPGIKSSGISSLTKFNEIVYFTADDGLYGTELWKSDGTETGTVLVKDVNPGTDARIHHQTKPCRQIEDFMMIRASISARRP